MILKAVEIRQLEIGMVEPLASSHGVVDSRQTVLVRVITDDGEGWGECAALNEPTYTGDWSDGEYLVLCEIFIPALMSIKTIDADDVQDRLKCFKHHHAAKAALEMAVLDAELCARGESLAHHLGATAKKVDCCVVVGLLEGDALGRSIASKQEQGYRHVKLKIAPGDDLDRIDYVQRRFPELNLRVDANGSYCWDDERHRSLLSEIDARGITLFEQPLPPDRWHWNMELYEAMSTPISLDESITSLDHGLDALEWGACDVIGVKPCLLGGITVAKELHDACVRAGRSSALGGMIETGVARAANLALAGLPGFEVSSELSPDGRWFSECITRQEVDFVDGSMEIPSAPGLGVELDMGVVDSLTRRTHVTRACS